MKSWKCGQILLLVLALGLLATGPAIADCRCCATWTEEEATDRAEVIFIGKVVEVENRWSLVHWAATGVGNYLRLDGRHLFAPQTKRTAELVVTQTLKGQPREERTIHTNPSSDWCGVKFEVGETYLVYAATNGVQMWTGQCARTKKIDDGSLALLR